MRILHGPVNIGNQPWVLSRAERRLGHRSDLVLNYGTWLGYPADSQLGEYGKDTLGNRFNRAVFGLTAPFCYDVIHYYFGRSFMLWEDFGGMLGRSRSADRSALRDALWAKRLGRRLVMTLQGCDVRLAGESNRRNAWTPCAAEHCGSFDYCIQTFDAQRQAMIRTLLPLMDRVFFLNPELGHYLPKGTFLPYSSIDIDAVEVHPPRCDGKLRIVHAPSDPKLKGTSLIVEALQRLASRFSFELILVQNKPHAEAIEIYRDADLAIDQVLFGWYGGFAVELMAMGKPVAAFIRDEDRAFVPARMWDEMPIIRIHPETIEADLARWLERREDLVAQGLKSRAYVERWHDPLAIAKAVTRIYADPSAPLALDEAGVEAG